MAFNIKNSPLHEKVCARWRTSFLAEGHILYATVCDGKQYQLFFYHPNGNKTQVFITEVSVSVCRKGKVIHYENIRRYESITEDATFRRKVTA